MNRFRVYVREAPVAIPDGSSLASTLGNMPLVGELDAYTEFSCTPRVNEVGSWSMKIPAHQEQVDLLRPGRGVVVFLADNADPVFSGPIRQFQRTWSKDEAGAGSMLVTGPCDNILFDERVGRASPSDAMLRESDNFDFDSDSTTLDWIPKVFDGSSTRNPLNSAEFIWALVQQNYKITEGVTLQDASRRVPYIAVPRAVPAYLTAMPADSIWKGFPVRMSSIRETVFAVAEAAGLNVRFMWMPLPPTGQDPDDYSDTVFLRIDQVADVSDSVVFGELAGNLSSYTVTSVAPTATRLIIGGETTTGDRRYYQYSKNELFDPSGWTDSTSVDAFGNRVPSSTFSDPEWGRTAIEAEWGITAEQFVDAREIDWPYQPGFKTGYALAPKPGSNIDLQFEQEALKNLVESGPKGLLQLDVVDTPTTQFGVHYGVGDIVRALVDTRILPASMVPEDGVLTEQVREVTLSSKADEMWAIKPVVGTADSSPIPWVYRELKRLRSKVDSNARREELDELSHALPDTISFVYGGVSGSARTQRPTSGQNYRVIMSAGDPNSAPNGLLPVDVDIDDVDLQYSVDGYTWVSVSSSSIQKDSTGNSWYRDSGGFTGVNNVRYWRARVNKQGNTSTWSPVIKYTIANGALNTAGTLTLNTPTASVYKAGTEMMLTGTDTTYGDLHVQVFDSGLGMWLNAGTDVVDPNHIYTGTTYQIPWVVGSGSETIRVAATAGGNPDFKVLRLCVSMSNVRVLIYLLPKERDPLSGVPSVDLQLFVRGKWPCTDPVCPVGSGRRTRCRACSTCSCRT